MTSVSSSKVCRFRIVFSLSSSSFSTWDSKAFVMVGWSRDDDDDIVVEASAIDCCSSSSISASASASEGGFEDDDGACSCCNCSRASKGGGTTGFSVGTVEKPNYKFIPTQPPKPSRQPPSKTKSYNWKKKN